MTHDIKVGMYARYNDNLYTVNYYGEDDCILLSIDKQREFSVNPNCIKTASTPMELIKVGDLVKINKTFGMVGRINFNNNHPYLKLVGQNSGTQLAVNNITKILTPNTNGGFDLQWESEKE